MTTSRYIFLMLAFTVCFITGCSSSPRQEETKQWMAENGKLKVLSTTGMIGDLITKIGGPYVDNYVLIGEELDPHSYQLVKGDDEKFNRADIIFYNGLNLEHGPSLHAALANHAHSIGLGDKIQSKSPEKNLNYNGQIDPHIWMDISLWSESIPYIVDALSKAVPVHAIDFQNNARQLKEEMLTAHKDVRKKLLSIPPDKRYLVTSHDAFNYFARAYLAEENEISNNTWQDRFAAPEGLAPDSQLSATDIRHIIEHLDKFDIMVIFPESNVSKDSIQKIVSAGREKGLILTIATDALYGDAMGPKGSKGDTYIKMIKYNADTLARYLSNNGIEERHAALVRKQHASF